VTISSAAPPEPGGKPSRFQASLRRTLLWVVVATVGRSVDGDTILLRQEGGGACLTLLEAVADN
jgi:hypothetical protein